VSDQHVEQEHRVTPLELFFDLVFVFAFTQVTTLLSADPTWGGLGRGLLIGRALVGVGGLRLVDEHRRP
jgi:low temperature requirement protein LtrA